MIKPKNVVSLGKFDVQVELFVGTQTTAEDLRVYLANLRDTKGVVIKVPNGATVLKATATVNVTITGQTNTSLYVAEQIPITADGGGITGVTPLVRSQSDRSSDTFTDIGPIHPDKLVEMMKDENLSGFGLTTTETKTDSNVTMSVRLHINIYDPLRISTKPNAKEPR